MAWMLSALIAIATLQAMAPSAPHSPQAQPLIDGQWLIPGSVAPPRQPDGNTLVIDAPDGLIVFDTGRHRWHRQAILDLARSSDRPIAAIVNSHWHLDHVSGNPDLKAAFPDARVYASNAIDGALTGFLKDGAASGRAALETGTLPPETAEDVRDDLATIDNAQALRPDVVVGRAQDIVLAGRKLRLNLASNAATAGDIWLYDPASRTVAVGDLVTLPVPFFDTACVKGWKAALSRVEATAFERLVPGHGKVLNRAEFKTYRDAFDHLADCAASSTEAQACAAAWTSDTASLRDADVETARVERFTAYYVNDVLRANGGNSKGCEAP